MSLMTSSPKIKSTISAETFLEPVTVRRGMNGPSVDARICEYVGEKAAGRATRRRERLLSKAAPVVDDAAAIEREQDVRDAVRLFIKAADWLADMSEDDREAIMLLVAQHQRGVIPSSEFHKAINDARRSVVGSASTIDYERQAAAHRRLRECGPTGGW